MQNIKKFLAIFLICVVWCFVPFSTLAETEKAEDNVKILTLSKEGNNYQLGRSNDTATFWEYPILAKGQSRSDGRFTIQSDITGDAVIEMTGVALPYDNEEAIAYLNALHLKVVDDKGNIVYDDSYAHIADVDQDGNMKIMKFTIRGGEKVDYSISLSCDFGFTGVANPGQVLVYSYTVDVGMPIWINYVIYGAIALAVIIVIVILIAILHNKKTSFGADIDF